MRIDRRRTVRLICTYAVVWGCTSWSSAAAAPPTLDPSAVVAGPEWDPRKGVWRYRLRSQFLGGSNAVEVLLPDDYDQDQQFRVLYVLPVEPGIGGRFGDGLVEVKRVGTHNQYNVICVAMAFDTLPWFGAHATNTRIRHEAYIKQVVVPLIEARYRTAGSAEGRLLLGFSKSGWGALTLLLRAPDFFGFACSWDAPLMMDEGRLGTFGTDRHFGTEQQFANYLPLRLVEQQAGQFQGPARMAILGHKSFGTVASPANRPHTAAFHAKLNSLGVKHHYNNRLIVNHDWHAGWVSPAVDALMSIAGQKAVANGVE